MRNGGRGGSGGGGDAEEGGDLRDGVGLAPVVAVVVAVTGRDEHFGFGSPGGLWLAVASDGGGEEAFERGSFSDGEGEMENGVGFGKEGAARGAKSGGLEKFAVRFGHRDGNGSGHGAEAFELDLGAKAASGLHLLQNREKFKDDAIAERVRNEVYVEDSRGNGERCDEIGEYLGGVFGRTKFQRVTGEGDGAPGFVSGPVTGMDGRLPFVVERISCTGEIVEK